MQVGHFLSHETLAVLQRAQAARLSYRVCGFVREGADPRLVVVLGEAHLKLGRASNLGRAIVGQFDLRGVETFPTGRVLAGRVLGFLVEAPRWALRALSLGLVKRSTIVDAKRIPTGHTVEIERREPIPLALHVGSLYLVALFVAIYALGVTMALGILLPNGEWLAAPTVYLTRVAQAFEIHFLALVPAAWLRRWRWNWILHPAIAILTVRDQTMAAGTVRMLRDHNEPVALVILGRAHLKGFGLELTEHHGFSAIEIPCGERMD